MGGAACGSLLEIMLLAPGHVGEVTSGGPAKNVLATAHRMDFDTPSGAAGSYVRTRASDDTGSRTNGGGAWSAVAPKLRRVYGNNTAGHSQQATMWFDLDTLTYETGSGTQQLTDNDGADTGTPVELHSRDQILYLDAKNGNLRIQRLPIGTGDTNPSWVTVTLSSPIPVPANWSHATLCTRSGKLLIGNITSDPNCLYEITVPTALTDDWTPARWGFTYPGGGNFPWQVSAYKKFNYCDPVRCIVYTLYPQRPGEGEDAVVAIRPPGT
jgi:hypothetical protein